jgi:hypothetical protein
MPRKKGAPQLTQNNVDPLERLRTICLNLPEATEGAGVGNPTWRVREKIFAMRHDLHAGRWSMWCKAAPGIQEMLVTSDPEQFFVPPYVGHHGWVGVWLDAEIDWEMVSDLVKQSYRRTAPKRLVVQLDGATSSPRKQTA